MSCTRDVCSLMTVLYATLSLPPLLCAQQPARPADAQYYPLAKGNVWTYRVHSVYPIRKDWVVRWRVTHAEPSGSGIVYQVWPTPMQSDDEAMALTVLPEGIKEIGSDTFILKFPVRAGEMWSQPAVPFHELYKSSRSFHVLSANKRCQAGGSRLPHCIIIEDDDVAAGLKTWTTYALDVGPVLYRYYKKVSGKETLVQTVTLTAHKLLAN